MKRFLCLLLAFVLFSVVSLADLPDISFLTHDELIELNHQISLRLFGEKLVNGVDVPAGVYIVGEDIPVGVYRIELSDHSSTSVLAVINNKAENKYIASHAFGDIWSAFEVGRIELYEGNVIEITYSPLRFYAYTGLFN